jgi:hypothetical protein
MKSGAQLRFLYASESETRQNKQSGRLLVLGIRVETSPEHFVEFN